MKLRDVWSGSSLKSAVELCEPFSCDRKWKFPQVLTIPVSRYLHIIAIVNISIDLNEL